MAIEQEIPNDIEGTPGVNLKQEAYSDSLRLHQYRQVTKKMTEGY